MGNSRRLFGDFAEWTWGSDGTKWRAFGDLSEWIWGSGCIGPLIGADWPLSGGLDAFGVALFPRKSHSCGHSPSRHVAGSPKTFTVVFLKGSAYFANSSIIGTLAEIR